MRNLARFCMNTNVSEDFQICISVPLNQELFKFSSTAVEVPKPSAANLDQ